MKTSVYNMRYIFLWVAILFSLKLACTYIRLLRRHTLYLIKPLSLYAPIPLDLQMKSCMAFIQSHMCGEKNGRFTKYGDMFILARDSFNLK